MQTTSTTHTASTPRRGIRHRYLTFKRLVEAPTHELEDLLCKGTMPKIEDLVGWEFRGCNTLSLTRVLGIRKFKKGFYREPGQASHELYGYNVPVVQNATFDPHMALPNEGQPKRFGFYLVTPDRKPGPDDLYPNSLLLDYARGLGNPIYEPARLLRDYVVQVDPDNPDLFLGKAYLAFGPKRVFVSFFVIERYNQAGL